MSIPINDIVLNTFYGFSQLSFELELLETAAALYEKECTDFEVMAHIDVILELQYENKKAVINE